MTIPCKDGTDYLFRRRIIQTPWFGIFLHDIYEPDTDQDPHDHPFDFRTIILRGGYTEEITDVRHFTVLSPLFSRRWLRWTCHRMTRNYAHRITHVEPGTKTLVLVGRRVGGWSFWTTDGPVPWDEYKAVR